MLPAILLRAVEKAGKKESKDEDKGLDKLELAIQQFVKSNDPKEKATALRTAMMLAKSTPEDTKD